MFLPPPTSAMIRCPLNIWPTIQAITRRTERQRCGSWLAQRQPHGYPGGDYSRTNETAAPSKLIQASTTGTFNSAYNSCIAGVTVPNGSDPLICGARAQFGTGIFGANLNPATAD
jgi:hypothetical protein